jgi:hypothetical protein
VLHALVTWLGAIGSGGESSPLPVSSPYSEIIRLIQLGIAGGVLYLIQQIRQGHRSSDETHSTILIDIKATNERVDKLASAVEDLTKLVTAKGKFTP